MSRLSKKVILFAILFCVILFSLIDFLIPKELGTVLKKNGLIYEEHDLIIAMRITLDEDKEDTREIRKEIEYKNEENTIIKNLLKQKVKKSIGFFMPNYRRVTPFYDFMGKLTFSIRGKRYIEIHSKKKHKKYKYVFVDENFDFEKIWIMLE